jgi:hypothetical protein
MLHVENSISTHVPVCSKFNQSNTSTNQIF